VTMIPMVALIIITMTSSYQKILSPNPRIGFLSGANELAAQIVSGVVPAARIAETHRLMFNLRLDALVTSILAFMILLLIIEALGQWYGILSRRREVVLHESPYIATRWAPSFSGATHDAVVGDAIGDD
jgi:carbon starvation protein